MVIEVPIAVKRHVSCGAYAEAVETASGSGQDLIIDIPIAVDLQGSRGAYAEAARWQR